MNSDRPISPATTEITVGNAGHHFIDGAPYSPEAAQSFPLYNPNTGEVLTEVLDGTPCDVDYAVKSAKRVFESAEWSGMRAVDREELLRDLADVVERHVDAFVELEAMDVGMPASMAREVYGELTPSIIRYFAGWPTKGGGQIVDPGLFAPTELFTYTMREPVGVVAAILPWNAPGDLAVWKAVPALAAGCTVVMKPSETANLTASLLARLAMQVGFPKGALNLVNGKGSTTGAALVAHPDVAMVGFTGSTETGRKIQELAARGPKRVQLELGGKSPVIVMEDADLDSAAEMIADGIFSLSGQICVAGSRVYAQASIYENLVSRLAEAAKARRLGPAQDDCTNMGPLVSAAQRDKVAGFVDRAVKDGATVLAGGQRPEGVGYFYPATVLTNVTNSMECVQQEIFGPVVTVQKIETEAEAIRLANDTAYGLAAYIWTRDIARAHRLTRAIRAGKIAVNFIAPPIAALPEGGRGGSGFGRDLGKESLDQYFETKSVLFRTV